MILDNDLKDDLKRELQTKRNLDRIKNILKNNNVDPKEKQQLEDLADILKQSRANIHAFDYLTKQ